MSKTLSGVVIGSVIFAAGCCNPGNIGSQAVTLNGQQTSMWCWAASGQMTMNFIHSGANVQQCDEANKRFGRSDCCNSPTPTECVNGGWPEYNKYSFTADTTSDAPLSWAQLTSQIYCSKKPFAFSWHWNGGGGHMMVATGYVTIDGVNYVSVNNPWPPSSASGSGGVQEVYTYDKYNGGSGQDHTHWNDYYNITSTGGQ
ncbi:MAG TPA: papain-like cysteine protease family protein [Bryobacteraceae bacterium]|nr:papain-like cysteine protease family protein [Bryobacteraceae bacterium]